MPWIMRLRFLRFYHSNDRSLQCRTRKKENMATTKTSLQVQQDAISVKQDGRYGKAEMRLANGMSPYSPHVLKWTLFQNCAIGFLHICGGMEDVQGVLTLFCSGAAQVCHALRVVELSEQLEVEEEDGDRQEEEEEVESGEASQRERTMKMVVDDYERRSELEPRGVRCDHQQLWKDARAGSVHVRHASAVVQVQCVNVVIGVLVVHVELLVVRVVPVFVCDAVVHRIVFS